MNDIPPDTSSVTHTSIEFCEVPPPAAALTPANYHGWDRAITRFLRNAGLSQALSGFEGDMLVMNPDFEKEDIPPALEQLRLDLTGLTRGEKIPLSTLDERKLEYVHLANDATPVPHAQLTRTISTFIARNRARNNASNRKEFLRKRRRDESGVNTTTQDSTSTPEELPTCARTDAVPVNRDLQMKYDIAKNEGGPLRRTVRSEQTEVIPEQHPEDRKGKRRMTADEPNNPTLQQHPGLGERFMNLEAHLAVRYVPSPPVSLLDRVRFIEEHIMRLEKDYPPWAALHFNQPNRGWPPPIRATPLIVPSHLTSTIYQPQNCAVESADLNPPPSTSGRPVDPSRAWSGRGGSKPKAKVKSSSLHMAVMQKLEVKKALAGDD